jgi:hypothetical protein
MTVRDTELLIVGRDYAYVVSDHNCHVIAGKDIRYLDEKGKLTILDVDGRECNLDIVRQERLQRQPQPPVPVEPVAAAGLAAKIVAAKPEPSAAPDLPYFSAPGGAWPAILSSIGLQPTPAGGAPARVTVLPTGAAASGDWAARLEGGAMLILEGASPLAESFGIRPTPSFVHAASLRDVHQPGLSIVWENALDLPVFTLPASAVIFTRDRWTGAPLSAGIRRGQGAVLWLATPPGERGYERYPYLLDALCDLGLEQPFRSSRLWAFFDSAYRSRVDVEYFASRWRKSGIAALHVAAWHFFEPDPQGDAYLKRLIEACHHEGIQVYAWLELPHVSEKFWAEHPEWREKTAVLQDAELDWRKLMNLANRDCFRAVSAGVRQLLARFDWDGVNLAELYFESLHGIDDPSRFTPMNLDVRAQFELKKGWDPREIFGRRKDDAAARQAFLDFRADLAAHIEEEWIGELEKVRDPKAAGSKADLDLVLTHVDDQFDPHMREALGADAARALPLLDKHTFTFLIEDPATIWNLGPQRYETIAEKYRALTGHAAQLAIDVNIVSRYQNVYPTRQQTGTELFQIVHQAARSFSRVALYFESSLEAPDLKLLPSAASTVSRIEKSGQQVTVDSLAAVGLPWKGPALVDGQSWPLADEETVWLPAGLHTVEPDGPNAAPRLLRLNAEVRSARVTSPTAIEVAYDSAARAFAVLDRAAMSVKVDGASYPIRSAGGQTLLLPRGHHTVVIECGGPTPLTAVRLAGRE